MWQVGRLAIVICIDCYCRLHAPKRASLTIVTRSGLPCIFYCHVSQQQRLWALSCPSTIWVPRKWWGAGAVVMCSCYCGLPIVVVNRIRVGGGPSLSSSSQPHLPLFSSLCFRLALSPSWETICLLPKIRRLWFWTCHRALRNSSLGIVSLEKCSRLSLCPFTLYIEYARLRNQSSILEVMPYRTVHVHS